MNSYTKLERLLEAQRMAVIDRLNDNTLYEIQWSRELRAIAERMPYSADQQTCFRISTDAQRLARENVHALAVSKNIGKELMRRFRAMAKKQNAANVDPSAA